MPESTTPIPPASSSSPRFLSSRGPVWRRWLVILGAWSVPAAATLVSTLSSMAANDQTMPTGQAVLQSTFFWGIYAILTPPVLWLAWRHPLRTGLLRFCLGLHFSASVAFALLAGALITTASLFIDAEEVSVAEWRSRFIQSASFMPMSGLFYWLIVMVGTSIDNARVARSQRDRASLLERQLAEARLHALRVQIQPHFLFNTLNSIASLVRQTENERALEMINRLGALLRQTLRDTSAEPAPLHEEIEFIEQYLAIEQARLGDRLQVRYDISDDARDALVPALLVQPLVENAIRHGIAPDPAGGELVVSARVERGRLEIRVINDGVPPAESSSDSDGGVGLRNIRERLDAAYGASGTLELQARDDEGGAVAILTLPHETGSVSSGAAS